MDLEAKKKLLRYIPSGLYVVGVKAGEELHGFTGSWLSQTSMKPPLIMLGVREDTRSFHMIKEGKVFTINYFKKEDQKVIEHFFKPATKTGERLGDYAYHTGKTGAPIIENAVGFLECEVRQVVEGVGDHAVVIGEVIEAGSKEDTQPIIMSDTPWHYGG